MQRPVLPIDAVLPALIAALRDQGCAVLTAPPGAGKTTSVPLAILEAGLTAGRIIMLEPRRLAARAAAQRMADVLGEAVGATVGYRIRGEAVTSKATRIEVVTEGILTRMIQSDPGLTGVGAVIFDEFHERSLNADLGLALTWELRGALRPELLLLVMSATLDAGAVAALLGDARQITATGRAFPVETRWLPRPADRSRRLEGEAAALIVEAAEAGPGGILVFLPGEGEIRRVEAALRGRLPPDCEIRPLFGAMPFAAQQAAIAPMASGRKVVLATAIAETSLTIEDIRIVVDCGLARRARFDPASGMTRLVTERVSRAEAEQRRGRAGRVAEGLCFRMWSQSEEGGLSAFAPPEIEAADLTGLALELALWGAGPGALAFLTPPPEAAMSEAQKLLFGLGAVDLAGRITDHGKALAALPLHPRLAHMLLLAGRDAAALAALLSDRDPLPGAGVDLGLRMAFLDGKGEGASSPAARAARRRIGVEARRLGALANRAAAPARRHSLAEMAALAYPDRIGQARRGAVGRYLLSGGKGARLDSTDPLARAELIVATDLDGDRREARVRQGVAITEAEVRRLFAQNIAWTDACEWSRREGRVQARRQERLGALVLAEQPWPDAPPEAFARAALGGLRQIGLTLSPKARALQARVGFLRRENADLPDVSDAALLARAEEWLLPWLGAARTAAELNALDLSEALRAALGREGLQLVERLAPAGFVTPLGRRVPIDYGGEHPAVELRLQEVFGLTAHPSVGPNRLPLRMTLLSPAQRPVQVTLDLPGFWATSYGDVRRDMRGRYPRHPWPEDPTEAAPTLRAKPRKG